MELDKQPVISRHRSLFFVVSHALLFTLSLLLSFGLAYNFRNARIWFLYQFLPIIPLNVGIKLLVFSLMGQYRPCYRAHLFKEISAGVSAQEYRRAVETLVDLGFENGWFQECDPLDESFVPDFSKTDSWN